MRVSRVRTGLSAVLLLSGLLLGGLVSAPSASSTIPVDFISIDFANWAQNGSSPIASYTGNIGSTFTVGFSSVTDTCIASIIKPMLCGITQMTIASSTAAVAPSNGVISTADITQFTVVRSGTLTLTPVGINVACGVGCTPLTIVITAVGPKNLVSSDCSVWNSNNGTNEIVAGHVGETFTVTFPNIIVSAGGVGIMRPACPNFVISGSSATATPASGMIDSQNPLTFTIWGSGIITLTQFVGNASINSVLATLTISVTALPSDVPPPDLLQQVGAPSASSCAAVIDTTLNWAGAPSGGWGTSWAQWMNQGKGGAVCSRSLYWLPSGKWSVRP